MCAVIRDRIKEFQYFSPLCDKSIDLGKVPGGCRRPGPAESENAKNAKNDKNAYNGNSWPGPGYFTEIHAWTNKSQFRHFPDFRWATC